jgi:hypothetical protein
VKQRTKQRPFARQQILNKQQLNYNNSCSGGSCRGFTSETKFSVQAVGSQAVKRRPGGLCEMVASLGISQLKP